MKTISESEFQREVSSFVDREVIYCVSYLISELRGVAEDLDDYDTYLALQSQSDYEEPARDEGWDEIDGEIVKRPKFGEDFGVTDIAEGDPEGIDEFDDADAWWASLTEEERNDLINEYAVDNQEEADSWEDACWKDRIDPHEIDVYEHWIVSNWLGRKLKDKGYVVEEYLGLTIWGRCCTGQAISMDGVIREIASETLEIQSDGKY